MAYHLLLNPESGRHKSYSALTKIKSYLDERGVEYIEHICSNMADTELIIDQISKEPITLVVLGGDGTLHNIINNIKRFDNVTLGIIPCGTGNDFSKTLKLNRNPILAMQDILDGRLEIIDLMQFDDRLALNVVGTGLDIEVLERCKRMRLLRGKAQYLTSLLITLCKFSHYDIKLNVDGVELERQALLVAVCNGKYFGGGMKVGPDAEVSDGKLNVTLINKVPKLKLPFMLGNFLKGRHNKIKYCESFVCESVSVVGTRKMLIETDGEVVDEPFNCTIAPRKLKIILPNKIMPATL